MNKRFVSNLMKRIVASCLVAAMSVSGVVIFSKTAKAAEDIVKGNIIYSPMNMSTYWSAEGTKTAPIKPDHVFAGWYTVEENEPIAIQEADEIPQNEITYAKFVPAYVLSVKTQVEAAAEKASDAMDKPESTYMRVLSSVDSGNYQNVGFEILLGDKEVEMVVEPITKVYAGLKLSATDPNAIYPKDVFGAASDYFTALDLEGIVTAKFSTKIYVRPYWTTLDGTKVEGLARNVRVEDKYTDYKYVSVPINLLTDGATPTEIAAGMVEVTFDASKAKVAQDASGNYKIDTGRLLKEMDYHVVVNGNQGKIIFVGNGTDVTNAIEADGLYANIRFQSNTDEKLTETALNLRKTAKEFCDWEEDTVSVTAW